MTSAKATRTLWVDRPWVDLVIGCGGWSAPLLLLAYGLVESDARRWSSVFYGLALVCNYPHYMATIHRAYARPEDRARYRFFTVYVTGALLIVALASLASPLLLSLVFTTYVMWSPWHYTGQNFGLAMMFLRRGGVNVQPRDRQALRVAFVASYVMLLAAFNQGASRDPLVLSLGLPDPVALGLQGGAGVVFLAAGLLALRAFAQQLRANAGTGARAGEEAGADASGGWKMLIPPATLYFTQACWFVIPVALSWLSSVPAPQTRYSSGILAVMHSAQYLWITKYYARRDAARHEPSSGAWSAWTYWTTLIAGGVALFLPGPWLASYAGHFDFTSCMLIVTAIVNIHHFILDGVVWKLRDPRVAQALVGTATANPHTPLPPSPPSRESRGRVQGGSAVGAPAASAWQGMQDDQAAGRASRAAAAHLETAAPAAAAARAGAAVRTGAVASFESAAPAAAQRARAARPMSALRPIAIAFLLVLAAVDQWRYTLALRDGDRGSLDTASLLNPYDSSVQMKRASVARHGGDQASAERALRIATDANPHDPAPYLSLERLLIESGRLSEAYAHSRALLTKWPDQVDTLVNAGVLAYRLGETSEAEEWWRRALQQREALPQVHLYLAELLDNAAPGGRTAEALPHYQRYLELLSESPDARRDTEPRQVALIVIKFADALSRAGRTADAAAQYDLALRIARQTGLQDVETLIAERRGSTN